MAVDLLRFDDPSPRWGNEFLLAGWYRADGYAGLEPRRQLDYRQLAALRVAGVRWVRRNTSNATIEGLLDGNPKWREVPSPLPQVRLLTRVQVSDDPARDLARIPIDTDRAGRRTDRRVRRPPTRDRHDYRQAARALADPNGLRRPATAGGGREFSRRMVCPCQWPGYAGRAGERGFFGLPRGAGPEERYTGIPAAKPIGRPHHHVGRRRDFGGHGRCMWREAGVLPGPLTGWSTTLRNGIYSG